MLVTSLHHYPVKGLRGLPVETLVFDARGPVDDRRWLVVDERRSFLTQRTLPVMATLAARVTPTHLELVDGTDVLSLERERAGAPVDVTVWRDTIPAIDCGDAAARWLSAKLGVSCRLVRLAPHAKRTLDPAYAPSPDAQTGFADAYPALLTTHATLRRLNDELTAAVPMNRFRPNVVVEGTQPFDEDAWSHVRIGELDFDAVKPCVRCVVITTDQETGAQHKAPLEALARLNTVPGKGAVFGMNLVHRGEGSVRVGDVVHVLARADRPSWKAAR